MTTGPHPDARTTYRQVLAQREFTAVLVAFLVSMLGTVVAHVALAVLVFSRTGSPLLSALAFSIGWLPHLFVGTLLSGLVDRVPARRLLVGCELVSAALVGLMVLPGLPTAGLLGLVLLQGCVTPVFMAARSASLPQLLPGDTYVLGRSLLNLGAQGGQLVGYALGGLLLGLVSPQTALALDAVSFLVSALVLRVGMRDRPPAAGPGGGGLAAESLDGLRRLWRHRRVRALLLLGWLPPMLGVVPEAVAVPFAADAGGGPSAAGLLLASVAAGVIVGDLLVARLLRPPARLRVMGPLALAVFVPMLLFALRPGLPVAAALLVLSGLGWGHTVGQAQAFLAAVPEDLRGRGLAVASSGSMLTQALGFVAGGAAAELLAPHQVVVLAGVTGLAVTGLVLRALRRAPETGPGVGLSAPGGPAGRGRAA